MRLNEWIAAHRHEARVEIKKGNGYNFAFIDEGTKREIRRKILKAVAIPGYQDFTPDLTFRPFINKSEVVTVSFFYLNACFMRVRGNPLIQAHGVPF